VTATAGAVLLIYGITQAGNPGAEPAGIATPLAGAVVLLTAFALIERRSRTPLLPPRLLRHRPLVATDTAALTVLAAPFGVSFVVTLYLQDVLHRSPWQTALTLVPGSVLSALIGRYAAPRALNRFGLRPVYAMALLVVSAGNALLIALDAPRATWLVVTATLVSLGLGMGLAYPAATVGGVQQVDPADHGTAAGLNNTALQVGGGLGLAAVATAVTAGLHGGIAGAVPPATSLHAVRLGALMATFLPLAGAAIAALGLRTPRTPDLSRRGSG
jgi:Na+/melibiose symporter-like transporter